MSVRTCWVCGRRSAGGSTHPKCKARIAHLTPTQQIDLAVNLEDPKVARAFRRGLKKRK